MKNGRAFPIILTVLIILILSLFFYIKNSKETVCFEENCFAVKIADNELERQKGLMDVELLEKNEGMLFVFDGAGKHPFWMKNTLIPLDILWIDENKEVVYIAENQKPCAINEDCHLINPNADAMYVLEINAGISERMNISLGDRMTF